MNDEQTTLRAQAVGAVRRLDALGLNRGSTGNVSLRCTHQQRPGMLITPTGMGADDLQSADLVWVGEDGGFEGALQPSSEWQFHQATYRVRPDVMAMLHTHSVHAAALACLRRKLPAFHYMVAVAGGDDVPLVPYFTFGTQALSDAVAGALQQRFACLLANHGLVVAGRDMAHALKVLLEIESLCEVYLKALAVGEPVLLSAAEMTEVITKFASYGRRAASAMGPNLASPGA